MDNKLFRHCHLYLKLSTACQPCQNNQHIPGAGGIIMFLLEIVFLLFVIAAAILLVQGVRKVPVQYAKRIVGNKQYGGARQYIPLKVNAANVMPIIFAQAIMFIPITLVGFSNAATASGIVRAFVDHTSFWYNFVFAILIIVFTYFYTAITINPNQMAEDMKRNNGFIPGIRKDIVNLRRYYWIVR